MEQVTYVCQQSPHRHLRVEVNGELVNVQFKDGSVKVDEETAAVLDDLFKRRPQIAHGIVKADRSAALALAKQHQRAAAIKGGVHAGSGFNTASNVPNHALQMQQLGSSEEDANLVAAAVAGSQDTVENSEIVSTEKVATKSTLLDLGKKTG